MSTSQILQFTKPSNSKQTQILTTQFLVICASKFLDMSGIESLSQVCKITKSYIPKALGLHQKQIYKNANDFIALYLTENIATFNFKDVNILEILPFISELFQTRTDLDLDHLIHRFRGYKGTGTVKRICEVAEEELNNYLIKKKYSYLNPIDLENSFTNTVARNVYY
jgi:hypothetical protein